MIRRRGLSFFNQQLLSTMSEINIVLCLADKRVSAIFNSDDSFERVYNKVKEVFELGDVKFVCKLDGKDVPTDTIIQESEVTDNCEITVCLEKEETFDILIMSYMSSYPKIFDNRAAFFLRIVSRILEEPIDDEELALMFKILSKYGDKYNTTFYLSKNFLDEEYDSNDSGYNSERETEPRLIAITENIINDLLLYFAWKDDQRMIEHAESYIVPSSELLCSYISERNARTDIVERMIELGVNVNSVDNDDTNQMSALMLACRSGHLEIAKLLLASGANPNFENRHFGWTHLSICATNLRFEIFKEILKYKPMENVDELMRDAFEALDSRINFGKVLLTDFQEHMEFLQLLFNLGAKPDFDTYHNNRTPLMSLAHDGHVELFQLFLKNGADVNARDWSNWSPLYWAVRSGSLKIVRELSKYEHIINIDKWPDNALLNLAKERGEETANLVQGIIEKSSKR